MIFENTERQDDQEKTLSTEQWTLYFQGEEKDEDYLRKITKKTHLKECKFQKHFGCISEKELLFSDEVFLKLIESKEPPTNIIRDYNQQRKKNGFEEIKENDQLKREISVKRHQLKEKKKQADEEEEPPIGNVEELKKEVSKLVFDTSKILALNENNIFVAGSFFLILILLLYWRVKHF